MFTGKKMPKSHKFQERTNEFKFKASSVSVSGSGKTFWTVPSQDHFVVEKELRTKTSIGSSVSTLVTGNSLICLMKGPLSPKARRGSFGKENKNRAWFILCIVPWFILPVSYRNWLQSSWARDHTLNNSHQRTSLCWLRNLFNPIFLANLHLQPQQHPVTMTLKICMKMLFLFVSNPIPHNFIVSFLVLRLWEKQ